MRVRELPVKPAEIVAAVQAANASVESD
jgi:hypothetical protein